jgi:hypothetical protein
MSNELPPPPPPPPSEGENAAPQAPKLKLAKPAGFVPPPPPAPSASIPVPPPVAATIPPAPAPVGAAPRQVVAINKNVGTGAVAFDLIALAASVVGALLLFLEFKSKG